MRIEAEVKITILDGEEKGKIETFKTVEETVTHYTEYGVIEKLIICWKHIHNMELIKLQNEVEEDENN